MSDIFFAIKMVHGDGITWLMTDTGERQFYRTREEAEQEAEVNRQSASSSVEVIVQEISVD